MWMSDHHLHGVSIALIGPPVVSQTNQSLLGPNDMLFENQNEDMSVNFFQMCVSMRIEAMQYN